MGPAYHGVTTRWMVTVRQTHKSRRRCGPRTMEQLQGGGLTVRQNHKSRRRCEPCLYHGVTTRWRARSETDSQIKEEIWALYLYRTEDSSEIDSQIRE